MKCKHCKKKATHIVVLDSSIHFFDQLTWPGCNAKTIDMCDKCSDDYVKGHALQCFKRFERWPAKLEFNREYGAVFNNHVNSLVMNRGHCSSFGVVDSQAHEFREDLIHIIKTSEFSDVLKLYDTIAPQLQEMMRRGKR